MCACACAVCVLISSCYCQFWHVCSLVPVCFCVYFCAKWVRQTFRSHTVLSVCCKQLQDELKIVFTVSNPFFSCVWSISHRKEPFGISMTGCFWPERSLAPHLSNKSSFSQQRLHRMCSGPVMSVGHPRFGKSLYLTHQTYKSVSISCCEVI